MAGSLDFHIKQGSDLLLAMTWKIDTVAVNLTGYTARLQARIDLDESATVLSLTTDVGGGITLGGILGTITFDRTAAQTALLEYGTFVYDLELISGAGFVTRLFAGELTISGGVTRA